MKIAITSSGLGHINRGVESWSKDLAYTLKSKGVNVTLYKGKGKVEGAIESVIPCISRNSFFSKLIGFLPKKFIWRFGFGSAFQIEATSFTWNLLPDLLINDFDIIHTQEANSALLLTWFKKLGLIKSQIILGHGTNESDSFLNNFENIQFLSPYDSRRFSSLKVQRRFIISNFINIDDFKSGVFSLRNDLKIEKDAFIILSVGMITAGKYKNMKFLIKTINEITNKLKRNIYFLIAGSLARDSAEVIDEGRRLLGNRVIFLKNYSRESMPSVYATADLFVLGSLEEMMPIALLEALASGLPCLANKYPVMEWMIGDGGECIEMSKEGELAQTIEKYYLNAELRNEKGIKARAQAVSNFSKEVVVDQIIDMYQEVLKCNP